MCLIVVQPPGDVSLSRRMMRNAWSNNDDGAGYMFATEGRLVVRKPFWTVGDLRRAYREDFAKYGAESFFVTHWRLRTHGAKNEMNTHPHVIGLESNIGVVHNGILNGSPPGDMSDTKWWLFTRTAHKSEQEILEPNFLERLQAEMGPHNKMAVLARDGGLYLLNEAEGFWKDKRWFSNSSYERCTYRPSSLLCYSNYAWDEDERGHFFSSKNEGLDEEEMSEAWWKSWEEYKAIEDKEYKEIRSLKL